MERWLVGLLHLPVLLSLAGACETCFPSPLPPGATEHLLLISQTGEVTGRENQEHPDNSASPTGKLFHVQMGDREVSVVFPDRPRESTRTIRNALGRFPLRLATYATNDGGIFLFGYATLPVSPMADPDVLLQGIVEMLLRDKADLTLKKIVYGAQQLPGREVTWRKGNQQMICRYILDGTRLYQIMVFGPTSFVTGDTARAFLDSFVLK